MNRKEHINKLRHMMTYARWVIVGILLAVLVIEIIGFIVKWSPLVLHPETIFHSYHDLTDDIFSILVTYEIFDLLYTLSPTRLMDVVLLTIARKVVLAPNETGVIQAIIAFSVLLVIRLAWDKFSRQRNDS
ncbi:hypothetical protein [Alicyclobacillus dauci]|uniref:Uncharacterized protein n=1 Tax=Alicyclobacillus dauci TaxID=1475485 RepID=A0ABY6Z8H5_9BACL|nr:hypothetical protein [Alicyclobacillus dauci]WAH38471.1 hypothetical protein NZD86_08320 [Alicyclobacillus dauci]